MPQRIDGTVRDDDHELVKVAKLAVTDLTTGAKAAADKMLGESGGPDGVKQTEAAFVDYVRRNATLPEPMGGQWRQSFLEQMIVAVPNPYAQAPDGSDALIPARNGVEYVEKILQEAFPNGWTPPPPPPPPSPLNAMATQPVDPALGPMAA